MEMFNSIWVDIPNYPNYKASPEGNFLSLNYRNTGKAKVLKQGDSRGYNTITLYKNKKPLTMRSHRLIAKIFCKSASDLLEVNHINGNKKDNNYLNLEWCTSSENQIHSYKILKNKGVKGSMHGQAKLKESQVKKIYSLIQGKTPYSTIAKTFSVSTATICNIKKGLVWGHITGAKTNDN